MLCPICGANNIEGAASCTSCQAQFVSQSPGQTSPVPPPPASPLPPPIPPTPPIHNKREYDGPPAKPAKKKRHVGCWVVALFLLAIAGVVAYFIGSMFWFGPKDLGVHYTKSDYEHLCSRIGLKIVAPPETYTDPGILDVSKYNFKFSNYKHIQLNDITQEEASAFLNYFAPRLWWFKNTQVKIGANDVIYTSSQADIDRILADRIPDVGDKIPSFLKGKINLYTEGGFAVKDNKIVMQPKVAQVGSVDVVALAGLNDPDKVAPAEEELSKIIDPNANQMPQMKINSLGAKDGKFFIDGVFPMLVEVTPK